MNASQTIGRRRIQKLDSLPQSADSFIPVAKVDNKLTVDILTVGSRIRVMTPARVPVDVIVLGFRGKDRNILDVKSVDTSAIPKLIAAGVPINKDQYLLPWVSFTHMIITGSV